MTAAPGPQQPDEVRQLLARGICPRSGRPVMPNGILRPACGICDCGEDPAAPSAQPDEFDPRCAYQRAGWDCDTHGPAQPVRDTGEGRR